MPLKKNPAYFRAVPTPRQHPLLRGLMRGLFRLLYRLEAQGLENLPTDGPALLAPNHVSYMDPILVGLAQNRPMCFMAWGALFSWGWAARFIRFFGAFPVDLTRVDLPAYRTALACLRAGHLVVLFPEGGRSPDGHLLPLQKGVCDLAVRAGVPVIPVWLDGIFDVWPRQRFLPRLRGRLRVIYGPPLTPQGPLHTKQERQQAVETMFAQLGPSLEALRPQQSPRNPA